MKVLEQSNKIALLVLLDYLVLPQSVSVFSLPSYYDV